MRCSNWWSRCRPVDPGDPDPAHARVRVGVRRGRRRPGLLDRPNRVLVRRAPGAGRRPWRDVSDRRRVAVASPTRPGGPSGRLYGANTAGAAIGSLAAGFFLIPILGLTGTTLTGMAASVASIALALSIVPRDLTDDVDLRMRLPSHASSGGRPAQSPEAARRSCRRASRRSGHRARRYGLAAAVLALTGFATFVYEVVWTRVLAMVVGRRSLPSPPR